MTDAKRQQLGEALRWALELTNNPSTAPADWLARDIDPDKSTVTELLTDPDVEIDTLKKAKNAFKTMRIVGEHAADRRLGARMYLASIAAALVHHSERITEQSDEVLLKALREFVRDEDMPEPLRDMADLAYLSIQKRMRDNPSKDIHRSP